MELWQQTTNALAIKALLAIAVTSLRRVRWSVRRVRWWFGDGAHRIAMYAMFVLPTNKLLVESGGSPSLKMRFIVVGLIPVLWIATGTQFLRRRWRRVRYP